MTGCASRAAGPGTWSRFRKVETRMMGLGDDPAVTWDKAIEGWREWERAAGRTAATIEQRTYQVRRAGRELGRPPVAVTTDELVAWLAAHEWAPNTARAYRAAIVAFYRWARDVAGLVEVSPASMLPPVSVPRGKPRPAPEDAFRLAMRSADPRARLAIMLAGVCGLRRGEIARARREDVEADLSGWSLRVVGKGGHVRLVPLPDELARELRGRPGGWLFPSPVTSGHLTPHHLGKLVARHLPDGLTTHTLRHRCGTVAYAATRDLRAVQELLGHARPETTALYTAVTSDSLRAAVAAAV